jgi:glycopeptide antibiotics resistance protein
MLPFDWTFTPELLLQRLTIQHLLPFYAYFQHTDLWNVYDLIATILSFVPISLYQAARLRARGVRWTAILWATTLLAGFLGTLVEGLQLFSLSRTGDLTDVLAYGGGGMLGAGTMYYYEQQLGAAHRQPPTTHPVVA